MNASVVVLVSLVSLALVQPTVLPVEKEPHHTPVFENAWVRVLDVRFVPGATSFFHRHALHNVAVRITGGTMRTDTVDQVGRPRVSARGSVVFHSASPPYVHRVANVGTSPVHIVDVELAGAAPAVGSVDDLAGHTVDVENDHVRITRVRLASGASFAAHAHPRGWLEVTLGSPRPGEVAWYGAGLRPTIAPSSGPREIVEIEPR